jgi:hypothetical protein
MALLDGIKKFFGETPNNQEPKAPNFYLVNGASGTKISNGRLMEEYNRLFQGVQKYETFDEMYRSDDKCAMAINVIEAPILSTDFYVK